MLINWRGISYAYLFWIASLMFGLPLLTSDYWVQSLSDFTLAILVPYILVSAGAGMLILKFAAGRNVGPFSGPHASENTPSNTLGAKTSKLADFLGVSSLLLATVGVAAFGAMKNYLAVSYPAPNAMADLAGAIYLSFLSLAFVVGFPVLVFRVFPVLRRATAAGKRNIGLGVLTGILYFFTYLILVNQIIITGYNTLPSNFIASPVGVYPYAHVFTAGPPPAAAAETLVYVPMALVQFNQYFNLILQPFELIFGIVLATLVSASVMITLHLIREKKTHQCYTGAAVSGVGGFLGFTATCPSCLVPTLISVLFGGFSSVASIQLLYSNIAGVVVPPLASVIALFVSLYLLNGSSSHPKSVGLATVLDRQDALSESRRVGLISHEKE